LDMLKKIIKYLKNQSPWILTLDIIF
jgi:hypothetical protein